MSLKTWKQEFYPTEVNQVSPHNSLNHSITKWTGLLPENLKKHGVKYVYGMLSDGIDSFAITTSSTCSLCFHFAHKECELCPLYIVRGNVQCDSPKGDERENPYHAFTYRDNPQPMLDWLHKAKKIHNETYPSNPDMPVS